jgi:hypothetical protein
VVGLTSQVGIQYQGRNRGRNKGRTRAEQGVFPFRMLRAAEFEGPPSLSTPVIPLCSSA